MDYEPPMRLCIPLPSEITRARGVHSAGALGANIRVRISKMERRLIEKEAERLGLNMSSFTRWCAVYAAHTLKKDRESRDERVDDVRCGESA